ncbi:MAG: hypothetical protein JWO03_1607 [Bacteroidetes bacterium]|nr:hypothetical protein [Bacteroidota bacterium]
MKTKLLFPVALIGLLFLASCQHATTTTNCINTFPYLANGHTLHYSITDAFLFSDTSFDVSIGITSSSDVYMSTGVSDQGSLNQTGYFHPCNDKLYLGNTVSAAQSSGNYERVNNVPVNTTWSETVSGTTYNYAVIGKNISVTVPAGTFVCDKVTYHEAGTINTDTIYCNAAVGDVKYDGTLFSYELHHKNF